MCHCLIVFINELIKPPPSQHIESRNHLSRAILADCQTDIISADIISQRQPYSEFSPTSTLPSIKIRSPSLPSSMSVRRLILWTTESFSSVSPLHTDSLAWRIHMAGVVHHWPRTHHSRWQPPLTSIQGYLWHSLGILYVLYTSDVARLVEALGLGAHLYADDTQLYGHIVHLQLAANSFELASRVLRAIDSIHEWICLEPALSQYRQDTIFIWLGTKRSLAKRETDRLFSLLSSLTELTSLRNLGFIIDQELNMKDHITKLCQSCYYQLRQIRTVRHSLISSAIQTLVHAFICTRVDFSNSLLYGTSAYPLDRLQSVLNSAARLILRIDKCDPNSAWP